MIRKLSAATALATAAFFSLASPASAQTYGGISLSVGSTDYGGCGYGDQACDPIYDQDDDDVQMGSQYYDEDPGYSWQAQQGEEQIERRKPEQELRADWQQEQREYQNYDEDDG